jgi:benzodiazapine receptor
MMCHSVTSEDLSGRFTIVKNMSSKMSPHFLQIANAVSILAALAVNLLANIIPLNNVYTGAVSDHYPNLFTPPGYVFAIWGAIYILLGVFLVYQVRGNQRDSPYLKEIGLWYVLGSLANIVWLFLFHYSYNNPALLVVSMVPIVVLLLSLLMVYVRLGIGKKAVSMKERLAVHLPVSVYLGWISLATIANTASVLNLVITGIPTDVQVFWTAAVIVVALLITMLMIVLRREIAFPLVVIWASVGIAIKQMMYLPIYATALTAAAVVAVATVLFALLRRSKK